jgi:hypothetical protein
VGSVLFVGVAGVISPASTEASAPRMVAKSLTKGSTVELRRTISRALLGILLASAVYLLLDSLGFGSQQRSISFSWGEAQVSDFSAEYRDIEGDFVRSIHQASPGASFVDSLKLAPGFYEVSTRLLIEGKWQASSHRLSIGEAAEYYITLSSVP